MAKSLCFLMPFRFSSVTCRAQLSKRKEKDLGTRRSRKKKPRDQNAESSGVGFAVLGTLKTDILPQNIIENTQMNIGQKTKKNEAENTLNDTPNTRKEEGEISETAYQVMIDYKGSLPKDSESLGALTLDSNDDLELNSIAGTIKPYEAENTVNVTPSKQKSEGVKTETAHKAINDYKGSLPKDSESLRVSTLDSNDELNLNSIVRSRKPSLSGEDILMALQRASIEKAKEARRNRGPNHKVGGRVESRGHSDVRKDFGEIRPIDIKSEWAARIESLEKQLKELKERADLT